MTIYRYKSIFELSLKNDAREGKVSIVKERVKEINIIR